ncbi:MAG: hypothetical protein IPM46_14515 [Flavobacteriales bacterium]|nr:hypothetical protein [Flavobacteriales bacterium]
MAADPRPTPAEVQFLTLAYDRFYDLFDELMADSFWTKEPWYRYAKVKEVFAVYGELLNYEPIGWVLEQMKKSRPPMESEIASELFKFIRNVVAHFPLFDSWDDVWVSGALVNWNKEGQSIDRFLKKYQGRKEVKYRFWEANKKRMTYLSIQFPVEYNPDSRILLKDLLPEKDGVKFSLVLMRGILDTQVESSSA